MKKLLLFMAAAGVMVSANAGNVMGKKVSEDLKSLSVKKGVSFKALSTSSCPFALSVSERKADHALPQIKSSSKMDAPESINAFDGDFIQYYMDAAGDVEFPNCMVPTFSVESDTLETGEVEEYIVIENALDGACELYAEYDAEASTLSILSQMYCQEHETYGKFAFFTYTLTEDGDIEDLSEQPYVLEVSTDETGKLVLTPAEQEIGGWLILMTEGDYKNSIWTMGENLEFFQPNGYFDGHERHPQNGSWTSYSEEEVPVYVYTDDFMGYTQIYNMFNSAIVIYEDGKGNFELPNGQVVDYGYDGSEYFPFYTYNCGIDDEGYLDPRMEKDLTPAADLSLPGFIAELSDGSKDYVFGAYNEADPTSPDWDYIYVAKFTSEDGYGYFRNLWAAIEVVVDPATDSNIHDVKAPVADKVTYNMMGQKVENANGKGLFLSNGKKFMKY